MILAVAVLSGVEASNEEVTLRDGHAHEDLTSTTPYTYNYYYDDTNLVVDLVRGPEGGDPAAIVFDAVKQATDTGIDALIVDTAGRLQNKKELMEELAKIRRVLGRLNPEAPHDVVLVLDATNGQNALQQIEIFREVAGVSGLIMTKLDGTARGGVLVAAAEQYGLPIHAIGVGEKIDDLRPFDPDLVARVIAGVA